MLMNAEQRAAYRDALQVERAGYEARIERAKAESNSADKSYFEQLIKQVDAVHQRSLDEEASHDDGDASASKSKSSRAKTASDGE